MRLTAERLLRFLELLPPASHYRVAYSGGRDSHVLLHLLVSAHTAGDLRSRVSAIHVNHGLQAGADSWQRHCRRVCEQLGVEYALVNLALRPKPGESLEAEARTARYRALLPLIEAGETLLTAHHQDDQAETVLLQLLRGAGPAGLAAMPASTSFGKGMLARPLLDVDADALTDYALRHGLAWVEDPSNGSPRFARNYLRQQVMPLLRARWPAMTRTLSRSARHCADSQQLIDSIAEQDLSRLVAKESGALDLPGVLLLAPPRARSVVRSWVKGAGFPTPASAHLERLLHEMESAASDRNPVVHWPGVEVRRYRRQLHIMAPLHPIAVGTRIGWEGRVALPLPVGELVAIAGVGGISRERWLRGGFEVRFDSGVDRIRIAGRGHSTELKKLYQQHAIPPWLRPRVPLIFQQDELLAVADLCVCEPFAAAQDAPGFRLKWRRQALEER